ncbi:hypothetical protein NL676_018037 [Syzygium grande]|nr:hypothetical protein NL676_018037 [Syzygium grande]
MPKDLEPWQNVERQLRLYQRRASGCEGIAEQPGEATSTFDQIDEVATVADVEEKGGDRVADLVREARAALDVEGDVGVVWGREELEKYLLVDDAGAISDMARHASVVEDD